MSNCSNCSSSRVSSPGAEVARSITRLDEQAEQGQGLIEYGFTCELCVCRAAACLAQNSESLLHSGILRTILSLNHHAWRLISRDPDQSEHGGLESAGPPSSFWLRVAVSGTLIFL